MERDFDAVNKNEGKKKANTEMALARGKRWKKKIIRGLSERNIVYEKDIIPNNDDIKSGLI